MLLSVQSLLSVAGVLRLSSSGECDHFGPLAGWRREIVPRILGRMLRMFVGASLVPPDTRNLLRSHYDSHAAWSTWNIAAELRLLMCATNCDWSPALWPHCLSGTWCIVCSGS